MGFINKILGKSEPRLLKATRLDNVSMEFVINQNKTRREKADYDQKRQVHSSTKILGSRKIDGGKKKKVGSKKKVVSKKK